MRFQTPMVLLRDITYEITNKPFSQGRDTHQVVRLWFLALQAQFSPGLLQVRLVDVTNSRTFFSEESTASVFKVYECYPEAESSTSCFHAYFALYADVKGKIVLVLS